AGTVAAADDQHGLHAVPPDARRGAARGDAARRARARPGRHARHAGDGQARRFRGVGPGTPQRAGLLVRPQSVQTRRLRRPGGIEMTSDVFTLHRGSRPLLVSLPHVGTVIPDELRSAYVERALHVEDTDWYLEALYDFVRELGASLLVPRLSRYVIDLNLGTATGESCAPSLRNALAGVLAAHPEFSHVVDGRFKGGHITRHYGHPSQNVHAVQLEMCWSCYMREEPPFELDTVRVAQI